MADRPYCHEEEPVTEAQIIGVLKEADAREALTWRGAGVLHFPGRRTAACKPEVRRMRTGGCLVADLTLGRAVPRATGEHRSKGGAYREVYAFVTRT